MLFGARLLHTGLSELKGISLSFGLYTEERRPEPGCDLGLAGSKPLPQQLRFSANALPGAIPCGSWFCEKEEADLHSGRIHFLYTF